MATPALNPSLSTALHADPPSGAVTDASHAIADLLPLKELDVSTPPASSSSETINSKKEHIEAPHAETSHTEAPHRGKGKVALIMSALCVSFGLSHGEMRLLAEADVLIYRLLYFWQRWTLYAAQMQTEENRSI